MRMLWIIVWVLSCMSFPTLSIGNSAAGREKSVRCMSCHGLNGDKPGAVYPDLVGKDAAWLEQALQAYKKGERKGGQAEVMRAYVFNLSDNDIADLAAYYASLTH